MTFVVAIALYAAAPETFPVMHRLPIIGLLVVGAVPLVIAHPKRVERPSRWTRRLATALSLVLVSANVGAGVDVLIGFGEPGSSGLVRLLVASAQVGLTQILAFALVFWLVDRGGPFARRHRPADHLGPADFDFVGAGRYVDLSWMPSFSDYLLLAARTAFAVNASGSRPITLRARILVGTQSFTGFALLGVVVVKTIVALIA